MKILFLSLFTLILAFSAFCQDIDKTLNAQWSSADSVWEDKSRRTYFYDDGNLTMVLGEYFFADSLNWSPIRRELNAYNNELTISEILYESWNADLNNWETDSRVSYNYTAEGLLESNVNEDWINQAWLPLVMTENSYDSNDILVERLTSIWDTLTGDWLPTYKHQYSYDTDEKLLNGLTEIYQNSQWVYLSELNYSYTDFGKIAETAEPLDPDGDGSLSGSRTRYNYDVEENLVNEIRESIFQPTQDWRPVLQYNYTNNADGSVQSYIRQFNIGIDSTQWFNFGKLSYFYLNANNLIKPEQLKFALYPNPAKDVLHVQSSGETIETMYYKVVTLAGKTVLRGTLKSGANAISTANLKVGVYLFELQEGDKIGFTKLVKE